MVKILSWALKNLATILGIIQAVIKLVKELLTGVVNLLFPFFPDEGKFEICVSKVRDFVNKADSFIEMIKNFVLQKKE